MSGRTRVPGRALTYGYVGGHGLMRFYSQEQLFRTIAANMGEPF